MASFPSADDRLLAGQEGRARIWLVEDSPIEAAMISEHLRETGDIELFKEGDAMLERLASSAPDVLVLDWRLPGMSGLEICRFIRARIDRAALPIIMLTASTETGDLTEALRAGANDYVAKPFDPSELLARVENAWLTKSLFDRLRRTEEELQAKHALLDRARVEAEKISRQKDDFLATFSHELRTPLNAIVGWCDLLRSGTLGPAEATKAISTIGRNARVQSKMIEDILDVTRITSGSVKLELALFDLRSIVGSASDAIALAAQTKQLSVEVRLPDQPVVVEADAERMLQIIANLLTNAVKFTPTKGQVRIEVEQRDGLAEVRVTDSGVGMPPDVLPTVFERFRQADSSTTRRHGGLGLGLSIARHLVALHGGTITAESAGVDRGSAFRVSLPSVEAGERWASTSGDRLSPPIPLETTGRLAGVRVLLVDDVEDNLLVLSAVLENMGCVVTTASSAADALALLDVTIPDIVVSDLAMPGEDGFSLVRRIRQRAVEAGGRVPALAVSASAREGDRRAAIDAGFQAHLPKPVDVDRLVEAIERLRVGPATPA